MSSTIENQIRTRMERYYGDAELADVWYNKPNLYFTIGLSDRNATPKELVDAGRGEEVIEWIELTIGR